MYKLKFQLKDKQSLVKQFFFKTYSIFRVLKNSFGLHKIQKINKIFIDSINK